MKIHLPLLHFPYQTLAGSTLLICLRQEFISWAIITLISWASLTVRVMFVHHVPWGRPFPGLLQQGELSHCSSPSPPRPICDYFSNWSDHRTFPYVLISYFVESGNTPVHLSILIAFWWSFCSELLFVEHSAP